jgi:hypothetical protein
VNLKLINNVSTKIYSSFQHLSFGANFEAMKVNLENSIHVFFAGQYKMSLAKPNFQNEVQFGISR